MTTNTGKLRAAMAEHAKAEGERADAPPAPDAGAILEAADAIGGGPSEAEPMADPDAPRKGKAGRKPVDPAAKRSGRRISVYVTTREHAALEAAAARAGLSASAWARMALLAAADTRPGA